MSIPNKAITRNEQYLAAMAGQSGTFPDAPITRKEFYLAKAAGQAVETPKPITREEMYLDVIAESGGGGGEADIDVQPLSVTENGDYNAPTGTAYSPVTVNVPTPTPTITTKTVTENGTYNAADDGADGYSEVTVDVPVGDTVYQTARGHLYTKNIQIETNKADFDPSFLNGQFDGAAEMETARMFGTPWITTIGLQNTFSTCNKLHTAIIEQVKRYSSYVFIRCPSLENVQLGSVGCGVKALYNTFYGLTQRDLTITIYVDDEDTVPLANSPWGATNATIIYRSSTTGEVRT